MLPLPSLSDREREVLRLLETPWGDAGATLEREVLARLGPGDEAVGPGSVADELGAVRSA